MKKIGLITATIFSVLMLGVTALASEEIPEKYDLRENEDALPEIFSQSDLGTCWSVASNTVYEIALRRYGLKDENGQYYKLSKIHNDWFTTPDFVDGVMSNYYRELYSGGFADYAIGYWLSGNGPVREKDAPYDESVAAVYKKQLLVPTTETMVTGIEVINSEGAFGELYTPEVDREHIKESILKYGAGIASVYYDSAYENNENNSYFCYESTIATNHEIIVVGWDDNYPAENFKVNPGKDGAWIIRNSWGNYNSENGYFYLSYYDFPFSANAVYFITGIQDNNYDNVYSPSGFASTGFDGYPADKDVDGYEYAAVVFNKTANTQNIHEIMLPLQDETEYSVYVVDNYKNRSSLSNRKLVASGKTEIRGYTLIEFDPVEIKGDKFAVVVSLKSDKYDKLIPVIDYEVIYSNGTLKKGVSYISNYGEKWTDLAGRNKQNVIFVYGDNIKKTTNVTFETEPWYAIVTVYKNGIPQFRNPDGSYDLEKGSYTYTLLIDEEETKEYELTVDGKKDKINVKQTNNVMPKVYSEYIDIGAKDGSGFSYTMYYSSGTGKYKDVVIKKITVNGTKAKINNKMDEAVVYTLPSAVQLKAKDNLEYVITYSNGKTEKITVKVKSGYSEAAALIKTKNKARSICDSFVFSVTSKVSDLTDKLQELGGKYNKNIYLNINLSEDNNRIIGKVSITNNFQSEKINVYIEADLSPVCDELMGWEAITSYVKTLKKGKVEIRVYDNTSIPSEFLNAVKGKNITVSLKVGELFAYTFNGKNVTSTDSFILSEEMFASKNILSNSDFYSDGIVGNSDFSTQYVNVPKGLPANGYLEFSGGKQNRIWMIYRMDENGMFIYDYTFNSGDGAYKIKVSAAEIIARIVFGIPGDLDNSSVVDSADLRILKNYLDGKIGLTVRQTVLADINLDGKVNSKDYNLLKKMVA